MFGGLTLPMIMAHAPVVLPAGHRKPLPYTSGFWLPEGLLHVSLALRLAVGDGAAIHGAWVTGSVLNVISIQLSVVLAI